MSGAPLTECVFVIVHHNISTCADCGEYENAVVDLVNRTSSINDSKSCTDFSLSTCLSAAIYRRNESIKLFA